MFSNYFPKIVPFVI